MQVDGGCPLEESIGKRKDIRIFLMQHFGPSQMSGLVDKCFNAQMLKIVFLSQVLRSEFPL